MGMNEDKFGIYTENTWYYRYT